MKLYRIALKELFWKAKDTKSIIVMTAIVMVMVSVIYAVGDHIAYSYDRVVSNAKPYDFMVFGLTEAELENFADKSIYDDTVEYLSTGIGTIPAYPTEGFLSFGVNSMDGDWQETTGLHLIEGVSPQNDWEIVLESPAQKYLPGGCKVGDVVKLLFFSETEEIKIEKEFKVVGFLDAVSAESTNLNAVISLHTGQLLGKELLGATEEENISYRIIFKAKDEDVLAMINAVQGKGLPNTIATNDVKLEAIQERDFSKGVSGAFQGIAVFIAIVSFAMLYNLIHISLDEKTKKLGMLKCLGMDLGQMGWLLCICALLYLLLGSALGLIGYTFVERVFGEWLLGQLANSFDSGKTMIVFRMDYQSFAAGSLVVAGIFVVVYAALAGKVHRLSPLEATHFREKKVRFKKSRQVKGKRKNVISFLGQRNLGRNKARSLYTGFTLGVTGLLFTVVINVFGNTDLIGNNIFLKKAEEFDLEFSDEGQNIFLEQSFIKGLLDNSRIESLEWGRRTMEGFLTPNKEIYVEIRSYSDELFTNILDVNGLDGKRYLTSPTVFCLQGEYMSDQKEVKIYTEEGILPVTIDGYLSIDYYTQYGLENGIVLIMNELATKELLGEQYGYNMLLVKTEFPEEVQEYIDEQLEKQGYRFYAGNLNVSVDRVRKELKGFVMIAVYILLCIGFMTVVNIVCNIDINIRLRHREFGIMSSIGLEENRIVQLIIYEMTQIAQVTLVVTMVLALMLSLNFVIQLNEHISYLKLLCTSLLSTVSLYGLVYAISYYLGKKYYHNKMKSMLHEE